MSGLPGVRRRQRMRAAVIASLFGVAVATVFVALIVRYASQRPDDVNLGDDRFVVGRADRFADRIQEQGAPILFKDPLTSRAGRELFIQHLGRDDRTGWSAIEAYPPGAPREVRCILRWDRAAQHFEDPCGQATFPADGAGLRVYPAQVDDRGAVIVDLRTRSREQ